MMERQATDWEKIPEDDVVDKGHGPVIYRLLNEKFSKHNNKKIQLENGQKIFY